LLSTHLIVTLRKILSKMEKKKYAKTEEQPQMAAEPQPAHNDKMEEEIDTMKAGNADKDWDDEWEELAHLACKVGIEQLERGEGYTLEEIMQSVRDVLNGP